MFKREVRGELSVRTHKASLFNRRVFTQLVATAPGLGTRAVECPSGLVPDGITPPISLGSGLRFRNYWAFRGSIYSTDETLDADQVRLLAIADQHRDKVRFARAQELADQEEAAKTQDGDPKP